VQQRGETFLGLDIGTSFLKGAVLDLDAGEVRHVHRLAFPEFLPGLPPLYREVDPYRILSQVEALLGRLVDYAPDCSGIVFCGQMHGLVLVDEQGEPVSNYISWSDQRALEPHASGAGSHFDVLAARVTENERSELGNEFRPSLPLSFLFWFNEQKFLPAGEILPASLPDFVVARLCGCLPSVDATHAAAYGAYNLPTRDWHREVIGNLGLERLRWPRFRATGGAVGYWNGIRCHAPVGDQQCALAGSLLADDELSLNISTGSQVAQVADGFSTGDYQTRPYFDGRFLKTITHLPAGRALNSLVRLLSELAQAQQISMEDPWQYIERAVSRAPETDVRASIAFFAGPCGDRGAFENLHEGNLTVGHLFRAAFESMAQNYRNATFRLAPKRNWKRLVFSGGLARRVEILRHLISEKLNAPYRLSPSAEDTLFGLLILALVFSGRCRSVAECEVKKAISPRTD
jgi:sugar (pentulose or hexulose) kinase